MDLERTSGREIATMGAPPIRVDERLGDLVTRQPDLARELERRGLDHCCHGDRTLAQASADIGLDPELLARELSVLARPFVAQEWTTMGVVGLIEHIEAAHHRHLDRELPRLAELTEKIRRVHGERHPELVQLAEMFVELRAALDPHLREEEDHLFPAIRSLAERTTSVRSGAVSTEISGMVRDHEVVGDLLARMRSVTGGYVVPPDGCLSYTACYRGLDELEADIHQHVHKENNRLFPMAIALESGDTGA